MAHLYYLNAQNMLYDPKLQLHMLEGFAQKRKEENTNQKPK